MAGINNGVHDVNGKRTTTVLGTSWTGLYAADGSINVVANDATHNGPYHPCGALRVNTTTGTNKTYDPSGAYYIDHLEGSPK